MVEPFYVPVNTQNNKNRGKGIANFWDNDDNAIEICEETKQRLDVNLT